MQLIMTRSSKSQAHNRRRGFLAGLGYTYAGLGMVLDRDFDNDNAEPITAECLPRTIRLSH